MSLCYFYCVEFSTRRKRWSQITKIHKISGIFTITEPVNPGEVYKIILNTLKDKYDLKEENMVLTALNTIPLA